MKLMNITRDCLAERSQMYSLGIILFEMSFPLKTAMERAQVLGQLRQVDYILPSAYEHPDKSTQGEIITSLIKHKSSERPSSSELLRSGKIPLHIEDETIRIALQGVTDPSSPFHTKFLSELFSKTGQEASVKDHAYNLAFGVGSDDESLVRIFVKEKIAAVFRRHGAVEKKRPLLLPTSNYYNTAARLLNSTGTLVQLPFDLTLSHARMLAMQPSPGRKTFAFGDVYRDNPTGGHPKSHGEADFDIVSYDSLDLALREAEVIKVIDEVIDVFPSLATVKMCYHINHSQILNAILDFCGINEAKKPAVKEIISKLNIGQWTWARIRNDLRGPSVAIPSTSLDELVRFDFRDTYAKAIPKLRSFLPNSEDLESTFSHIEAVITYLERFGVKRKICISPLSSFNDKFYRGNILFQCIHDARRREVFAAGGRYDGLIAEHRPNSKVGSRHAVGFSLGWETLCISMARYQSSAKPFLKDYEGANSWLVPRRCEVLVDSFDPTKIRSIGIEILQELWSKNISAELVIDAGATDNSAHQHNKEDATSHAWIVHIKQDGNLNVRSTCRKEDTEIRTSELVDWLRSEMRDRDRAERKVLDRSRLLRLHSSSQDPGPSIFTNEREPDVRVLTSQSRGKKTNRRTIIEEGKSTTLLPPVPFILATLSPFSFISTNQLAD